MPSLTKWTHSIGCPIYTTFSFTAPIISLSVTNPLPISSQPSPYLLPSSNLSIPDPLPISFQPSPNPTCLKPVPFLHPTSSKPAPNLLSTFSEKGPSMFQVHKFNLI